MKRAAEKSLENPKKSVASIFTNRKGSFDWKIQQSLLFGCTCLSKFRTKTVKLACFDFDSTLVTTASKKKYPVSDTDFKPLNSSVIPKINSLVKTEYVIVVFSNQSDLFNPTPKRGCDQRKEVIFKGRIEGFFSLIDPADLHVLVMAAGGKYNDYKDKFRKPKRGMWDYLVDYLNSIDVQIDVAGSFFVGDAAGRPAGWKPNAPKDFSDSDILFADAAGISFYTPDEFFLNEPKVQRIPKFDWKTYDYDSSLTFKPTFTPLRLLESSKKEIIVLVGSPGSGKSSFCRKYFKDYMVVSQDQLKSKAKCISVCESSVKAGKSCIIDNTNPEASSRKIFVDIAKKYGVGIRCFYFNVSIDLCKHNDIFRSKITPSVEPLPSLAFDTFFARFQKVQLNEGFSEIKEISFIPEFDEHPEHENIWKSFLI